ncbi:MAG: hypothetical protein WC223_11195 [Bacteroidales bacterium]|jgi:hypothetical protein
MESKFKISILLILLGIIIIPAIQGYKECSDISLKSKTECISNTWKVESYKINGDDYTYLVSCYTETFSKSGVYSYSWGKEGGAGAWSFQNKNKEIKMRGDDSQSSRTLFIQKLEKNSFWYYYMEGTNKNELRLVAN